MGVQATSVLTPGFTTSVEVALRDVKLDKPKWYGWASYVVPNSLLKPVLLGFKTPLTAELTHGEDDNPNRPKEGWIGLLSYRTSEYTRTSPKACIRRLYDVLNHEKTGVRICNINYAEAFCAAGGLSIDDDTNVPTLPGNKRDALDLLYVRAEAVDPKVKLIDLVPFVPTVISLSAAIVETPELLEHLQDDAPFNCLRPWER